MKIACAFLLLAAIAVAPSTRAEDTTAVASAAKPAVAVVVEFSTALQAGDFKRVEALLDPNVLVLESGNAERSRAEYLKKHAGEDAAFLKKVHVMVKRRSGRADGNLAYVTTESDMHLMEGGKMQTIQSTETMVLQKAGDAWHIVHIHWSSRTRT
jgi:ketosteroid isomerase-like protein